MAHSANLQPRDPKTVQLSDIGDPLIIDGIGRNGYHHVIAQLLLDGWDEEDAYKNADDFWRGLSANNKVCLDEEAEERFNDYVLSKE